MIDRGQTRCHHFEWRQRICEAVRRYLHVMVAHHVARLALSRPTPLQYPYAFDVSTQGPKRTSSAILQRVILHSSKPFRARWLSTAFCYIATSSPESRHCLAQNKAVRLSSNSSHFRRYEHAFLQYSASLFIRSTNASAPPNHIQRMFLLLYQIDPGRMVSICILPQKILFGCHHRSDTPAQC